MNKSEECCSLARRVSTHEMATAESFDPQRGAWLIQNRRPNLPNLPNGTPRFDEGTGFRLVMEATAAQPDYAKLFLSTGGAINTAAGAGATDFCVTGSSAAVNVVLHGAESHTVSVDLPSSLIKVEDSKIVIDAGAKLNVSSQRVGAAINGTLVDTHAGAGSVYLANLLRARETHTQVPCVYGTLASYASTVGLSNVRVLDSNDDEMDIEFVEDPAKTSIMEKAEAIVDDWAQQSWDLREKIVYKLSPALTKSVAKVPVGVNDKGYELVHNVVDQAFPFSVEALNSIFEQTIGVELEYNPDETKKMLEATANPGLRAAVWGQTIAAACSTAACYLVAYRADGRTVMQATGSAFEATESWLRTPMRTPCESNDCDGTALLVLAMLQTAVDMEEEDLKPYPYIRAVKNAVFPYYTYGVAVVGATSAEASSGGGDVGGEHVAGHALALMIPTLDFLGGLDRAAQSHDVGGRKVSTAPKDIGEARFGAVFNDAVLQQLPEDEATRLRTRSLQNWTASKRLQPFAVEGTTPASPILYLSDTDMRYKGAKIADLDIKALALASPNVGRSIKTLHVGGRKSADPHRFYHDFVELSLHPSHPLYADAVVRAQGGAATQFVFARPTGTTLSAAGTTPRQLCTGDYVMVPMYEVDTVKGDILDFTAAQTKQDVIPPRAGPMMLTESQSKDLRRSITALKTLNNSLTKTEQPGHCVAYIFAYSSLVNNPLGAPHTRLDRSHTPLRDHFDTQLTSYLARFRLRSHRALLRAREQCRQGRSH